MWRLLRAELGERLRVLGTWSGVIIGACVALTMLTQQGVPVVPWGVTTLATLPLIVNFSVSIAQSRAQRLHRHIVLPITIRKVGVVWLATPLIVMVAGGLLAAGVALVYQAAADGNASWSQPLRLTCVFLLVEQWLIAQRIFEPGRGDRWRRTLGIGMATAAAIAGPLAVGLWVAGRSIKWFAIDPYHNPTLAQLPYVSVVLLMVATLFAVNLNMFVRRDVIAN